MVVVVFEIFVVFVCGKELRMRLLVRISTVLAVVLSTATMAYAQASIAGVVRDTSGAVLPGVTVEASSSALIEKTRTVTTDGTGQYRIVDLRPGVYSVTFSLSGFNGLRRDGIQLEGCFRRNRQRRACVSAS